VDYTVVVLVVVVLVMIVVMVRLQYPCDYDWQPLPPLAAAYMHRS
jgi:hypothetical protein